MLLRMLKAIVDFGRRVLDRILLIDEEATVETSPTETDDQVSADPAVGDAAPTGSATEDTASLDGHIHVFRTARTDYEGLPICIARPRNIEEAEAVGERLKNRIPVILNLETTDEAMAQRIADYMSGAVHMVDAKIGKGGRMVWVYAPVDMEVEQLKLDQEPARKTLFAEEEPPLRNVGTM